MGKKYDDKIENLYLQEEHTWKSGLSQKETEALKNMYNDRYDQ